MKFLERRRKDSHKGDFGHLFVVAGSLGYAGAALLCSRAALLSGSGLVTLAVPKSLYPIVARKFLELMILPLPETKAQSFSLKSLTPILKKCKTVDAVAIGPGLSQQRETIQLVHRLIPKLSKPAVMDADGLNAIAKNPAVLKKARCSIVMTPHPGEMGRLIRKTSKTVQEDRKRIVKQFALRYNVTTVLKGYRTVVASPQGKLYINRTGNPGMATGGCGDVLTGIIGSFLGQGMDPFLAACRGVYVHGLAGDLAVKEKGEVSLIASDLLRYLPQAFKKVSS
ncbi:MAG: NAD(P)H-hydrate dehydratase [Candidatus Omnitrophica bacterium]|nr:NAD(P)H-hydrate dehydratase [Candidatus Omnitrophota bacterium]